jgi:hypothetical protein
MAPRPRELFLHPAIVVSVAVLIANDHWLKAAHGNWWTGKLSDLAGLAFFPLLLAAGIDTITRARLAVQPLVAACAIATAAVFALVKTLPAATAAYRHALGFVQALVTGEAPFAVDAVTDPTDLVALPCVALSIFVTRLDDKRRSGRRVTPCATPT